jgi:hypothetical protein
MNLSAHITMAIVEGDSPSSFPTENVNIFKNTGTKIDEILSYLPPPPLFSPGNTE